MSFAPTPEPSKAIANEPRPQRSGRESEPRRSPGLTRASTRHTDLARWLLVTEMVGATDPTGQIVATAAERVCQKLCVRRSRSISPAGAQAIVSRALHLARADVPFLADVSAGTPPDACLLGLPERVQDIGPDQVIRGLQMVLAILLDLLVGFIGDDLTFRLVREVWPELPQSEPANTA